MLQSLDLVGRQIGLVTFLVLSVSCSPQTSASDPGVGHGLAESGTSTPVAIEQDPACGHYIDCLTAIAPAAVGEALTTYGADGTCWGNAEDAAACVVACEEALDEAYDTTGEEACRNGQPVGAVVLAGRTWTFSGAEPQYCDDQLIGALDLVDLTARVEATGPGVAFELVVTAHVQDQNPIVPFQDTFQATLDCTLDTFDFVCAEATNGELTMSMTGSFGPDYDTADANVALDVLLVIDPPLCSLSYELNGTAE